MFDCFGEKKLFLSILAYTSVSLLGSGMVVLLVIVQQYYYVPAPNDKQDAACGSWRDKCLVVITPAVSTLTSPVLWSICLFVVVICELPLLALKSPQRMEKKTKQVHAAFWPFVYIISVNSNIITKHIIYKMQG